MPREDKKRAGKPTEPKKPIKDECELDPGATPMKTKTVTKKFVVKEEITTTGDGDGDSDDGAASNDTPVKPKLGRGAASASPKSPGKILSNGIQGKKVIVLHKFTGKNKLTAGDTEIIMVEQLVGQYLVLRKDEGLFGQWIQDSTGCKDATVDKIYDEVKTYYESHMLP